jgi:diguanylate cyclase (GGDEF)-like protein/PAS domain S-box-containing protein
MSPADPDFEAQPPLILERISDAFLSLDVQWRVAYLNEKAAAFFDRPCADLLGRFLWQEFPEIVGEAFYRACHQAVHDQAPITIREYFSAAQRWYEMHFYPAADGLNVIAQDVTEQHETRRQLEENEQRYRSLFELNADAVFTFDLEGCFVDANAACETVSGYTREELLGTSFVPLVIPEDRERTIAITNLALQGEAQHEEIVILHKSGQRVAVHITKVPIVVDGQIVGIFGLAKDITPQKQAEAALRESEKRYRRVSELTSDVAYAFEVETDGTLKLEWRAGQYEDFIPYTYGEMLARGGWQTVIHPEDLLLVAEHQKRNLSGQSDTAEFRLYDKDGAVHWLHSYVQPEWDVAAGRVVRFYGATQDITRRKETEAALRESEAWMRAVAEASPVAMTITRWKDSIALYVNRHFQDLVGLTHPEEILGYPSLRFYAMPEDRAVLCRLLAESAFVQNWEVRLRRIDGTTFWISGEFQRMVYRGEEAIFSVYHDITEQKKRLEKARAEAEQDSLTGLLNHRAFHRCLEEEAALAQKHGTSLAVVVLDLDNFKFFNDAYGHAVGDDVLRQVAAVLKAACRARDTLARFGGDEFALLLPDLEGEISAAAVASLLEADLGDVTYQPPGYGSAIPVSLSLGVALFPSEAPTRLAVMQIADERLLRAKTGAFTDAEAQRVRGIMRDAVQGFSMLDALVSAVDNKDRYTRRHSEDVMTYSLQIARVLGFSDSEQQIVAAAALLHDVGKIGVPDHILRKPGKLTEEDFEAVKMHPSIGAVIVAAVPGLEATVDAVRHHHERWDGGGYPAGWSGAATPLMARLMAVADAYSAMTTDRPYRKGMSPAEAKRILAQGAGAQWDPDCVQAFLAG